jgi:hypothetical protein
MFGNMKNVGKQQHASINQYPPPPADSRGSASEKRLQAGGAAGPSLRALLFWCGGSAVCEAFGGWKTAQTACFLVRSESDVRHWGPWPAVPVRPSGPCCFGVAKVPFVRLGGWKTAQPASFLVGSESDVRHWGPRPAGPVRPSGPCCLAVAQAPFWVRQL